MVPVRRADAISLLVVAGTALVGLAVLPRLPPAFAIHFSAGGTPDDYVAPLLGVLSVPAIMLGTFVVLRVAERIDPPNDPRTMPVVTVSAMVLMALVHLTVIGWNLGYPVSVSWLAVGALLWSLAIAGYVVVRETTAG
jgi:uncharacterized membrane protein